MSNNFTPKLSGYLLLDYKYSMHKRVAYCKFPKCVNGACDWLHLLSCDWLKVRILDNLRSLNRATADSLSLSIGLWNCYDVVCSLLACWGSVRGQQCQTEDTVEDNSA